MWRGPGGPAQAASNGPAAARAPKSVRRQVVRVEAAQAPHCSTDFRSDRLQLGTARRRQCAELRGFIGLFQKDAVDEEAVEVHVEPQATCSARGWRGCSFGAFTASAKCCRARQRRGAHHRAAGRQGRTGRWTPCWCCCRTAEAGSAVSALDLSDLAAVTRRRHFTAFKPHTFFRPGRGTLGLPRASREPALFAVHCKKGLTFLQWTAKRAYEVHSSPRP